MNWCINVITETGRVVATSDNELWVQTIRKSACSQCSSRKGCGQALLAQIGREPGYIKVGLRGRAISKYPVGSFVSIGIEEHVLVKSTLLIYLLPLLLMMVGIVFAAQLFTSDVASLAGAILGLLLGSAITRALLAKEAGNPNFEPILIGLAGQPFGWPESKPD